jgi:hypothetical protein
MYMVHLVILFVNQNGAHSRRIPQGAFILSSFAFEISKRQEHRTQCLIITSKENILLALNTTYAKPQFSVK